MNHDQSRSDADRGDCASLPPYFDRLNYFYGQMLGHRDFAIEQRYFREKIKLHNRCLHGHGVVCGLEVTPTAPGKTDTPEGRTSGDAAPWPRCRPRVLVECGFALDPEGNELVVRDELCVDLWDYLDDDDRARIRKDNPGTLHLSLCYHEVPIEPTRPIFPESCGPARSRQYGKLRDAVCIRVTVDAPPEDARCGPCGTAGVESCEPLAKISNYHPDDPAATIAIDNSVRRPVGLYRHTRVAGTSWAHGGAYDFDQVDLLLQTFLRVKFTRAVRAETIRPGVFDVFLLGGGGSIQGDVKHLPGEVKPDFMDPAGNPHGLRYDFTGPRYSGTRNERLSSDDRVLVVLRGAFVLDHCCQPVDGAHVGGWVPLLEDGMAPSGAIPGPPAACAERRGTYGLWTSGNGLPGANFESWFTVLNPDAGQKPHDAGM